MYAFIVIHSGSQLIGDISCWGKISGNFLPMLNFWKIYNPTALVFFCFFFNRLAVLKLSK